MKIYRPFLFVMLALICASYSAHAQSAGTVKVTILPAAAVNAGAQWMVDSGALRNSGATVVASTGVHTITFSAISGYTTPASFSVIINANQLTTTNGTYVIFSSQTLTITHGYSIIANQFVNGTNGLNTILPGMPVNSQLMKWNLGKGFFEPTQIVNADGEWIDAQSGQFTTTTLSPVEGAIFFNPSSRMSVTFSGTATVPILPLGLSCGRRYMLSRQTNGIGIFENMIGISPPDGTQMYLYDMSAQGDPTLVPASYQVFTFCGGGWLPNEPEVNVASAAFFEEPCNSTSGCLTVSSSNIVVTASGPTQVSFAPVAADGCGTTAPATATVYCRPPSGSVFPLGSTPVHCVALDTLGNVASSDFTVTVTPPPIPPNTQSRRISFLPGYTLFAYQFINGGNTLLEIMTNVPDGTVVSKYDNNTATWSQSTYSAAQNAWVPPNITLKPGEGAFLFDPTNATGGGTKFTVTFTGQSIVPVLPLSLKNPILLVSRQVNAVGNYQTITGQDPTQGATLYKWNGSGYDTYIFNGTWSPSQPTVAVGESCWISPDGSTAPPGIPVPPTISHKAVNLVAKLGTAITLKEDIAGDPPFQIQWRLNGNPIPGATNPTYVITSFQLAQGGTYDVLVENSIGTSKDVFGALVPSMTASPFSDFFAKAGALPANSSGVAIGSNLGAGLEKGELTPGNIPGGASVWITWTCPLTGVATFSTAGSGFDTLLGIYTGSSVADLNRIVFDDDGAGFLCSLAQFNCTSGVVYRIQVDGFYGASGNISLSWSTQASVNPAPVILVQPSHLTLGIGNTATFSVTAQGQNVLGYQWFKDGALIAGVAGSNLTLTKITVANVGVYQVNVTDLKTHLSILSFPTDLQINVPEIGKAVNTGARAETKYQAATDPTVRPGDPYDPTIVAGYSGEQICSSYGAVSEPSEPVHCGVITVATIWHAITAPATGLLSVGDNGTGFKGVLAVYTSANLNLTPLACSTGHAAGKELCTFAVTNGVTYQIAMSVTNVADITGPIFIVSTFLSPPLFTALPSGLGTTSNVLVTLNAAATGSATIGYQWMLNGTNLPGQTNATLGITSFKAANSGNYSIMATNSAGTNVFSFAPVYLDNPLEFVNTTNFGGTFFTQLVGVPNSNYIFETSSDGLNWTSNSSGNSATGILTLTDTVNPSKTNYVYRARLRMIQ